MHYLANVHRDGDTFIARFHDLPEVLTEGDTLEAALHEAADALRVAVLARMDDGEDVPPATAPPLDVAEEGGVHPVPIEAAAAAKLAFYQAFRQSGITRVELAQRIGKSEAEVRRMLDPYHASKLASLEAAMLALGMRFVISVEAA